MKNFLTPQQLGPGSWFAIHSLSINSRTREEHKAVLFLIKIYANKLFCSKCQEHFRDFIRDNPPIKFLKEKGNLFYWTWLAHEFVNQFLGKKGISYSDAKRLYSQ